MKKKIVVFTFVFLAVFASFVITACAETKYGDYLYYTINADNTAVTITDCETTATEIVIPDKIENLPVTSIGRSAFSDCDSLASITIPDSVKSIGRFAFWYCGSLEGVYITDIAAWCNIDFGNYESNPLFCANKLYLNNNLVTSLIIPDSVGSVGNYAFYGCSSLESITIPSSVKSIGYSAFYDCGSLESVYITDIAAWCNIDFGDYESNPLYYSDKLYINNKRAINIVIPDGVKQIPTYAFSCDSLKSVTIPDSVTGIGDYAFYDCNSLDGVYISDITAWCNIDFENSYSNPLFYAGNLYLDNELVTELIIPNSIKVVGDYVFQGCESAEKITIPNSVTSIGGSAFAYCSNITSITIPDSVTSIESSAFSNCRSLKSVTIGKGVTSIEAWVFYFCSFLDSVYITDMAAWCNIDFGTSYANPLCYANNLYLNNKQVTELVIPEGVTSVSEYAFRNFGGFSSLKLPKSMSAVSDYAFNGCNGLKTVMIPETVYEINKYAFNGCSALSVVEYGGSETEWSEVYISTNNNPILKAEIRFNSALASDPAENELTVKQEEAENDSVYTFSVLPEKVANNCFVYAAAYDGNGRTKKLVSLSKTELLTSGESKINVNKDDGIEYVIIYVWTGELKPVSQVKKVEI